MFKKGEQVLLNLGNRKAPSRAKAVFVKEVPDGFRNYAGAENTCLVCMNGTEIIVPRELLSPYLH